MDRIDLLVSGGRVVLPGGVAQTAIAIDGGRIVAIGDAEVLPAPRRTLDATGLDVLPGVIDAHCHLGFDDWRSLPRSAAFGGVTTIIPFVGDAAAQGTLAEIIRAHQDEAARHAVLDHAFHAYLFPRAGDHPEAMIDGVAEGIALGVRSYKMFMAYRRSARLASDGFLFRAFQTLAAQGGLPMVHAENGDLCDALEDRLIAAGKTGPEHYHDSRPPAAEAEAIARAARLAAVAGSPLYVVHLSTGLGLAEIQARQQAGQPLWTETCPQYLALSNDHLLQHGAFAKIAPPLRHADDVAAMWRGLREGWIPAVASDHSPHDPALKAQGNENVFYLPSGAAVPFGMPGTETLLPILHSEGVVRRGLPLTWLARVLSENPARLFGLYPRKGVIAPGSDADLTLIDPAERRTLAATELHSRTGYSIYEGIEVQGWPVLTLQRGHVVLEHGALQLDESAGRYLPAGASLPPLLGPALWASGSQAPQPL